MKLHYLALLVLLTLTIHSLVSQAAETTTASDDDDDDSTTTGGTTDADDSDDDSDEKTTKGMKKTGTHKPTTPMDESSFDDDDDDDKKEKKDKKKGKQTKSGMTTEAPGVEDATIEISAPPLPTLEPEKGEKKGKKKDDDDAETGRPPTTKSESEILHEGSKLNRSLSGTEDPLNLDFLSALQGEDNIKGGMHMPGQKADNLINGQIQYHFNDITNITPASVSKPMNVTPPRVPQNKTVPPVLPPTPPSLQDVEKFAKDVQAEAMASEPGAEAVKNSGTSGSGSLWLLCLLIIPIVVASVIIVYVLRKQDKTNAPNLDFEGAIPAAIKPNVINTSHGPPPDFSYLPEENYDGHVSDAPTQPESLPPDFQVQENEDLRDDYLSRPMH